MRLNKLNREKIVHRFQRSIEAFIKTTGCWHIIFSKVIVKLVENGLCTHSWDSQLVGE